MTAAFSKLCGILGIPHSVVIFLFLEVEIAGIPNPDLDDQTLPPPLPDALNASSTLAVIAGHLALSASTFLTQRHSESAGYI